MSSTSWSSSRGGRDETQIECSIECHHGVCSKPRTVKSGSNRGRRFYGCALWPNADCSFFQWVRDYPPMAVADEKKREKGRIIIDHLDEEKKDLENQIAKLKKKNQKLKAKIEELQELVSKHAKGEKYSFIGLLISWIVFAAVMYGKSK
ncbi:unnamed protein product [Cuscuta epithymum]|uniref:GRF-type domain-containing protein n=1 Tax=Cuscuta epithymum TaxID=186058 RepID=A0AAV0DGT3_9ASTE|nr:unnamed protein product [Cuscuta epithymum]